MSRPHRVLAVDDDPVVREAYRGFFSRRTDYELCGEAVDGGAGVTAYGELRPDLVLMDMQMPVLDGIGAIRSICTTWPDACCVAMTTFGTREYVVAALRAGAAGYLLKDVGGPGLLLALGQALAGDMPLSAAVRRELVSSVVGEGGDERGRPDVPDPGLTPREVELLGWLAQGLTNAQIATRMHVSEGSVKQYLSAVGRKLGVVSRTAILVRAVQLELVDPRLQGP